MDKVPKSEMETPLVDFGAYGTTLKQFVSRKRSESVREEFLPRVIRRRFRVNELSPYPGYKSERRREDRPHQERSQLTKERTQQAIKTFKESDELMLRLLKEELEERNGLKKWWEPKTDAEDEIADNHYFDLKRLFNEVEEEIHQKYWIEDDWAKLWDHATSKHGHLPMKW